MSGEFHVEILEHAEPDESGALAFSAENERRLKVRFRDALTSADVGAAVDGFVRAVAALQAGGQVDAAGALFRIGSEVVEEVGTSNTEPAEKLKAAVTGAANLSKMRPVGTGPVPDGALKATAFIRPLPKRRG